MNRILEKWISVLCISLLIFSGAHGQASSAAYVHTTNTCNLFTSSTRLDHQDLNGISDAHIQVTPVYPASLNGQTRPVGVHYDGRYWNIVNEDNTTMASGISFNVVVVRDALPAASIIKKMVHRITGNSGSSTIEDNTVNNNQSNKLFITNLRTASNGSQLANNKRTMIIWNHSTKKFTMNNDMVSAGAYQPLTQNARYNVLALENNDNTVKSAWANLGIRGAASDIVIVQRIDGGEFDTPALSTPLSVRYNSASGMWFVYEGNTIVSAERRVNIAVFSKTREGLIAATPGVPREVKATAGSPSQITVSWQAPAGNSEGYIIQSSLQSNFSTIAQTVTKASSDRNHTFTGLNASTTYYIRVKTFITNHPTLPNCQSSYVSVNAKTQDPPLVTPSAPDNLSATALNSSEIRLNWNDVAGETTYVIERSTNGTTFTKVGNDLPANTTTFTDKGLRESTRYYYRIYAKNPAGNSGYSRIVNTTTLATVPAAPANLKATAVSSSEIQLTWSDTGNETAYVLERSTNGTTFTKLGSDLPANTTTYSDKGLQEFTRYYYRISAKNTAGNSPYSQIVNATTTATVPVAPANLKAMAVSSSEIQLTWNDTGNETAYVLERSTNGTAFTRVGNDLPANTTTYSDKGLQPITRYYYRILAKNSAGNSPYSAVVNITTQNAAPPVPGGLAVTAVSSSELRLTWTDVARETAYVIERSTNGTTFSKLGNDLAANTTSFSDRGLHPSTRYYYRIYAKNAEGNSGRSGVASATTRPIDPAATQPGNLQITSTALHLQELSWTDNSSNELGFEISRAAGDSTHYVVIDSVGAGITAYSSEGLRPATKYYYKVRAYFRGATSNYSNTASAITDVINASEPPANLSIYPNPSSDYITIKYPGQEKISACTIYNTGGKAVMHSDRTEHISLAPLPSGRYTVRVVAGSRIFTIPLIKI